MKFTLSWLKDHLDTRATLDEIVTTLTKIGLEVEHVSDPSKALSAFTIAYVKSAVQHPNADRLRVCEVDVGSGETVQVVCGAPNARADMKTVFAKPGTYIPGKDFKIDVGTIRGVTSAGMLCSGAEIELSQDSDGILELPETAVIGASYSTLVDADPVIEIGLTPNRPDCAGVRGIARDLAAAGLGELKPDAPLKIASSFDCPVNVTIEDDKTCPAFALRLVKNVKNTVSPDWMQARLKAIGLKPISALVDITNYLTFDRARPLHVFDADKVKGGLTVRTAKPGETLAALDGRDYKLDDGMTVIADETGVESLAGIMGGASTGVDENTVNVLIESALWNPLNIAQTGRKLGLSSDARYRFERGIDPASVMHGLDLATKLITEHCGGAPSAPLFQGAIPEDERLIRFPASEVERLTGTKMQHQEIKIILESLGFWLSGENPEWRIAPPSWRPDIHGKADLVEEVVRIAGIDRIQSVRLPPLPGVGLPALNTLQKRKSLSQRTLAARGLLEAVTWSFIPLKEAQAFGGGAPDLQISNPISVEMAAMRPSLLPGLLSALRHNFAHGVNNLGLFEVGQVFEGAEAEQQKWNATGLRSGLSNVNGVGRDWSRASAQADLFNAKADCAALLASLGAPDTIQATRDAPGWYHPGKSGAFRLGKNVLAIFGELHPSVLKQYGIEQAVCAFEIMLDALPVPRAKATRTKAKLNASALQAIRRDFAFIVDENVEAGDVLKAVRGADKTLVTGTTLFDVYQGKGIDPGKKSLALEVVLQPKDKTLSDAEIDAVSQKIIAAVTSATGASLRG